MMYSPIRETCTDAVRVSHRTPLLLLSLALLAAGCEKPVTLHEPTEPLFVGSYAKIHVNIQASSGVTMDDLDFVVPAGPKGGLISLSRDTSFDPQNPVIMLLGGHELGTYHLQAIEKSTNDVLDEVEFTLTTKWPNDQAGPSLWVSGNFELPGSRGSTWGGGSTSEPDHYNVIPALGTTRLAVLLVDTASQRFDPGEIQAMQNLFQDVAFDGRLVNGERVSTAHYYREVSYSKFDFAGQVFGPVELPGDWSDYFGDDDGPRYNLYQACVTAGDSLIDYSTFDTLVCVAKSVYAQDQTVDRAVWAHADAITAHTAEGTVALGTVAMPDDAIHGHGWLSATLAHELGHTLGLGDIYAWSGHTQEIQDRQLGAWALMANQGALPHPVLVHRMKLGWVPMNAIKLYNFQAIGGFVDETVTLHPVENTNPSAGRYSGVEIRISPGWDYYFEYRVAQTGQIGDQGLPTNDRVLGTDVTFVDDIILMHHRKPVMLLANDSDGDGPVLGLGQDYEERDISTPNFSTDFRAEVTRIDGTSADLRILYGVESQPDPYIRRWPAPPYQSPDIEVSNPRSLADPAWTNVPWLHHPNTLTATVTNGGDMDAPGVWVDFYVKDYTVNGSDGTPILIGSDQQDVPAQQSAEFSTEWMPSAEGHYCIEARIRLYVTPGPNSVVEVTELNNIAQSNYDRFISASASAHSREIATVEVHNPFNETVRAFLRTAKSTNPLFRTYLEHTWLLLKPGETRDVQVMFEYAFDANQPVPGPFEQFIGIPNDVSIVGTIELPNAEPEQVSAVLGGVTAQIVRGRATEIVEFAYHSEPGTKPHAEGLVRTLDTGDPVGGGKVILSLRYGQAVDTRTVAVQPGGWFTVDASGSWENIRAYYVPSPDYGDAWSQTIAHP
jgi:M6 family metalloprotease-like protein